MLRIGDFSNISRVSVRMLRHYDRIDLFKPSFIDDSTGYRSYEIEQLPIINRIVFLKDIGFSLKEIKTMIDRDIDYSELKNLFHNKRTELKTEINTALTNLRSVESRLQQIEYEGELSDIDINLAPIPKTHFIALREIVPSINDMGRYCYDMHRCVYDFLKKHNIPHHEDEVTAYHNESYTTTDLDVEIGIIVDPNDIPNDILDQLVDGGIDYKQYQVKFREIGPYDLSATCVYSGCLNQSSSVASEILLWINKQHYRIAGPLYEFHLSGPCHNEGKLVDSTVVHFQIPVRR